jgi:hypothetical protein
MELKMQRRGFLLGLGTTLAAPAVVRASSLMKLWVPPAPELVPIWGHTGLLYHKQTVVGVWTQQAGRIRFKYDATKASGELNTGSGDVSVATALNVFPASRVTTYPDYRVRA